MKHYYDVSSFSPSCMQFAIEKCGECDYGAESGMINQDFIATSTERHFTRRGS